MFSRRCILQALLQAKLCRVVCAVALLGLFLPSASPRQFTVRLAHSYGPSGRFELMMDLDFSATVTLQRDGHELDKVTVPGADWPEMFVGQAYGTRYAYLTFEHFHVTFIFNTTSKGEVSYHSTLTLIPSAFFSPQLRHLGDESITFIGPVQNLGSSNSSYECNREQTAVYRLERPLLLNRDTYRPLPNSDTHRPLPNSDTYRPLSNRDTYRVEVDVRRFHAQAFNVEYFVYSPAVWCSGPDSFLAIIFGSVVGISVLFVVIVVAVVWIRRRRNSSAEPRAPGSSESNERSPLNPAE